MRLDLSRRQWLQSTLALGALEGCSSLSRSGIGGPRYSGEERLAPATLEALKAKTTVFVLQPGDTGELAAYRRLLPAAWTLTPLEVVMPDQLDQYRDATRYQYLTVDIHYDLEKLNHHHGLVLVDVLNDEDNAHGYCRYPLSRVQDKRVSHFKRQSVGPKERQFYNWHPSTLALYLRAIQRDLESGMRRWLYEQELKHARLPSLKQQTLYVPDYALTPGNGTDEVENVTASEVLAQYPYRYEVIAPGALEELLGPELGREESSLLVLDCAFTGAERFVTVYSPTSGILYRRSGRYGATLTPADVAKLLKSVGA